MYDLIIFVLRFMAFDDNTSIDDVRRDKARVIIDLK